MELIASALLVVALVALITGVIVLAVAEITEIRNKCLMEQAWTITGRCLMGVSGLCIAVAWALVLTLA
ncbi:MAG: hypothetical protein M3Z21_13925 [Pseudomonadota bacterium]|nr:hypothetical protein [Pseudomonadota bacterium]